MPRLQISVPNSAHGTFQHPKAECRNEPGGSLEPVPVWTWVGLADVAAARAKVSSNIVGQFRGGQMNVAVCNVAANKC